MESTTTGRVIVAVRIENLSDLFKVREGALAPDAENSSFQTRSSTLGRRRFAFRAAFSERSDWLPAKSEAYERRVA